MSPSSLFGGTWILSRKLFRTSYNTDNGESNYVISNGTNITSYTLSYIRIQQCIRIRLKLVLGTALSDTTILLGSLNLQALGLDSLQYTCYVIGSSDGGNSICMGSIAYDTGNINITDVVGVDSVASGQNINFDITLPVSHIVMLDSFCDEFCWKRTA